MADISDKSQVTGELDQAGAPPVLGLALGGGSARGWGHIGVMRTLMTHGIKPNIIAGTSIGAVIGACYAAGQLDVVEEWARSITRRGLLGYLDFSLSGAGLISGSRLLDKLEQTLGNMMIEDLPIAFAAIATEIGTGHEIWLTRGRLVDAVRASYALPGVFPPVRVGGRWLVDGALVNPVPVSAARALGARLVIAVNLNVDMFGRGTVIYNHGSTKADADQLIEAQVQKRGFFNLFGADRMMRRPGQPGLSTVMVDAFNIIQDRITRARLAGDPPDVLIGPRLGRIGLFDFHRADDAIRLGAEATERALASIMETSEALT